MNFHALENERISRVCLIVTNPENDRLGRLGIVDCAKDGGEEFFTEMHCVL